LTDHQQAVPPSGQVSPDGQSVWNGTAWVPNPNLPKQKKKHTLRNVILAFLVLCVLFIGGCMALIGGAANEVSKSIDEHENQKGGSKNPITITEGKAFSIGDIDYLGGWKMKNDALDQAEIVGLKVKNNSDEAEYPEIEFRLWRGSEELAEISCGLLKEVQPGTTAKISCSGDQRLPKKFDKLTVQNSF
jgi:hypothetical protein